MSEKYEYFPPRLTGILFHVIAVLILSTIGLYGFWRASQAEIGPIFLLYLLPALLAIALVPLLIYRLYALQGASYSIVRDGFHLRWGLRIEDIPMDQVLWVRSSDELDGPVPFPRLFWPGCVLGTRRLPDGSLLEFMASRPGNLVLIAVPGRIFALSPARPSEFIQAYRRFTELGSLSPLPAHSSYPAFLLARFWSDRTARNLFLLGIGLSVALLTWVSMVAPGLPSISLRLGPGNVALEQVPAVRLLLLPALNGTLFLADFLLGLFFYRREPLHAAAPEATQPVSVEQQSSVLAYLLWGSGVLTPILFIGAVFFIVTAR